MADETAKSKQPRVLKKTETVRQKAERASEASGQPRRLHKASRKAGAPFRAIGRSLSKLGRFKPLRIIGLILVPPYFRNSWKELRQVTWPTWKVSLRLTFAVIIFSIVFGILVALLDYGLDKLFKQVLLK